MIDLLLFSITISLAFSALTVIIYFFLWQTVRQQYLLMWTAGWLAYCVRLSADLFRLFNPDLAKPCNILIDFWAAISAVLLIQGIFLSAGRTYTWNKGLWLIPLVALGWSGWANLWLNNRFLAALPSAIILGFSNIFLAWIILQWKSFTNFSIRSFLAVCLLLAGLHRLDYPFIYNDPALAPFGYPLAAALNILIAVGFLSLTAQQFFFNLKQSELRYRQLIENAADGIFLIDQNITITEVNQAICTMLGYERHELIGISVYTIETQVTPEKFQDFIKQLMLTPVVTVYGIEKRKDGSLFPVETHLRRIIDDEKPVIIAIVRDITERVRFENELYHAREQLDAIIQASPLSIIALDKNGLVTTWNQTAEKTFGWVRDDVIGHPLPILSPQMVYELNEIIKQNLSDINVTNFQTQRLNRDGNLVDVVISTAPLHGPDGQIIGTMAILADITEGKKVQDALADSEQRYRSLIEMAPDGIYIYQDNKIGYINPAGLKMFRVSDAHQMKDISFEQFVHPLNLSTTQESILKTLSGELHSYRNENRYIRPDGSEFPVEANVSKTIFQGRDAIQTIFRDISERKAIEDERTYYSEQLKMLAEISIQISELDTPVDIINLITQKGCELTEAGLGVVSLTEGIECYQIIQSSCYLDTPYPDLMDTAALSCPTGQKLIQEVCKNGQPMLFNVTEMEPWETYIELIRPAGIKEINGFMIIPLIGKDKSVIGLFQLFDKLKGEFTNTDLSIILQLSQMTAYAIEKAHLIETINQSNQQIRSLAQQVIEAQEKEKSFLSRELHDETGQILTALKLNLQMICEDIPDNLSDIRSELKDSSEMADMVLQNIRLMSHALRPPRMDLGFNTSLESLCQDFAKRSKILVNFMGSEINPIDEKAAITLYRLLQEGLTNISKHANATAISVRFEHDAEKMELTISDNGKGFDPTTSRSHGIGHENMIERLKLLNGDLLIHSEIGIGTTLVASIPLEALP
jgi:PAS domain S-box-containing protein